MEAVQVKCGTARDPNAVVTPLWLQPPRILLSFQSKPRPIATWTVCRSLENFVQHGGPTAATCAVYQGMRSPSYRQKDPFSSLPSLRMTCSTLLSKFSQGHNGKEAARQRQGEGAEAKTLTRGGQLPPL